MTVTARSCADVRNVETTEDIGMVKELFLEYARSLDFNLCFQDFEKELAQLPGDYAPPSGALLLLSIDGKTAGCVALRKIDDRYCEMKRLFVRPEYRRCGYGRILAEAVIRDGKNIGYSYIRLDTVPSMEKAIHLYHDLGFRQIEPYRNNPVGGALFMELELTNNTG